LEARVGIEPTLHFQPVYISKKLINNVKDL